MSDKHKDKIAIEILSNEYADYSKNSWHYDREYKMLIEAQTAAWQQANEAAESKEQALNLGGVIKSCENCRYLKRIRNNAFDSDDISYTCEKGKFKNYGGEGLENEHSCSDFNSL